jgi:hypothetical protein
MGQTGPRASTTSGIAHTVSISVLYSCSTMSLTSYFTDEQRELGHTVLKYYNHPLLLIDVGQSFLATQWPPSRILIVTVSIDRLDEFDLESGYSNLLSYSQSPPERCV